MTTAQDSDARAVVAEAVAAYRDNATPSARGVKVPTLDEVRTWPATVSLAQGGRPFGISRSNAYDLIKRGEFPARVLRVGGTYRVITSSIVNVLEGKKA